MSTWDSFGKLTKLDFAYNDVVPGVIPQIYANSRNQVEIIISVKAEDNSNGHGRLNLTKDDFYIGEASENNEGKALLYLCDPITGEKIISPWKLSNEINDYTKAVNHDSHHRAKREDSEITYVRAYLSCSESNISKNFSIGIHIPGVGDFNTSQNGTRTKNVPKGKSGSVFKSPKLLSISTLYPINYSLSNDLPISKKFDYDNFKKVVSDMKYKVTTYSQGQPGDRVTSHSYEYEGESSYSYATIELNTGRIFKKKNILRNNAKYPGINLVCNTNHSRKETADIIWLIGGKNFDASFLFVEPEKCGLKPHSTISVIGQNPEYEYIIGPNDSRHYFPNTSNDIPKIDAKNILVVICNHRIPEDGGIFSFDGWKGGFNNTNPSHSSVDVDVTDEFGNSGIISISFKKENWPEISAKGKLA